MIEVLSTDLANKIAAGEVVERPASVVKELVENSIDAGSREIAVEIRAGGKNLIRVSDNGIGMDRDDALKCVERHATSKIRSIGDLEQIGTFGFRGEALPSIASVSQLELLTRTADALQGTKVEIEGGIVKSVRESGCSPGTTVSIENLFFNVPARLKFLKTDTTEMGHISNQLTWAALAHPQIRFSLTSNKRTLLDVRPCNGHLERIRLIYGKDFAGNLMEFSGGGQDREKVGVHCIIGKSGLTKANRNYQLFFLNRRPIRSKLLSAAVKEAMKQMLPKDRHAVIFLFLSMNGADVDVNVHPAKIEVRFRDERRLYSQIVRLLNSGIYEQKYIPKIETQATSGSEKIATSQSPMVAQNRGGQSTRTDNPEATSTVLASSSPPIEIGNVARSEISAQTPPIVLSPRQRIPADQTLELLDFEAIELKTNLFKTYIIAEGKDSIFIIDQHVADERVRYEQLVDQLKGEGVVVQGLLVPITIEATPTQVSILEEESKLFKKFGFEIEHFGGNRILVRSIPALLAPGRVATTVIDLLDQLQNSMRESDLLEAHDDALTMLACKSAVKAGDSLSTEEMLSLVKELSKAKHPFNCPHSRPIIIEMPRSELEARFKRR